MNILAIDPGVHEYGFASINGPSGKPFNCGLSKTVKPWPNLGIDHGCWGEIVVEKPEQRGRHSRVRMSDIIDLSIAAGILGGPNAKYVPVSRWKGNRSKEGMHERLMSVLTMGEKRIIESVDVSRSKRHNVLDAVCLLMWRLGRL